MATENGTCAAPAAPRRDAISGTVIAVSALAMAALMAWHPSLGAHETTAELLAEGARVAAATEFVHAGMLVAIAALVFGFLGFARGLGLERPSVRLGTVAYVVGALAGGGAAVINGLTFPAMASRYAQGTAAELEIAGVVLSYGHFVASTLAGIGLLAWSIAVLGWSLATVGCGGAWRWIAICGLFIGAGPAALFAGGHLRLDVHGFGLFVFAQALWSAAAGITLAIGRRAG